MRKEILLADVHFHPHEVMAVSIDGVNSRLLDCAAFLEHVLQQAIERDINTVRILGDFFHTRKKIDVEVYNLAYSILSKFRDNNINLFLLAGNHDIYYKNSASVTSLRPLEEVATIVTEPMWVNHGNASIGMFPYYEDHDKLRKLIENWDYSDKSNLIFMIHAEFIGSMRSIYSKQTSHGIDASAFPAITKYVLMGHYHMHQKIDDKIMYLGSPLQISRGESGEDKFFFILDTDDLTIEAIPTPTPRFCTIEYPSKKLLSFYNKKATVEEAIEGNYVEVVTTEPLKKNTKFFKSLEKARNYIVTTRATTAGATSTTAAISDDGFDAASLSIKFVEENPHDTLSSEFLNSIREKVLGF